MKTLMVGMTVLGATGCASSLATLQTARPIEPKHVQVTGGTGLYVPLGPVATVIGQSLKQADAARQAIESGQPYTLTEEDQQDLLTAGLALAVMPPSQGYELSVRTGLVRNLDVGLRYSVSALRVDAKYRIFHLGDELTLEPRPVPPASGGPAAPLQQRSLDLAFGLGVSRHFFQHPMLDLLGFVKLDDFSRWDVEAPLYLSAELGDFFKLYGAAKYVYSRTEFDAQLVELSGTASGASGFDLRLPAQVDGHFVGATAGVAVGYRWVHLWLELTGGYTFLEPELFGRRRNLGGPTFYPAAALSLAY